MSQYNIIRAGLVLAVAVTFSVTNEMQTQAAPINYFNDYESSLNLGSGGSIFAGDGGLSVVLQSTTTNLAPGQYARANQGTPATDGIIVDLGQQAFVSDGTSIDFSLDIGFGPAVEDWTGTVNIGIYDGDPASGGTLIDETGPQSYSTIYPEVWSHSGTMTLGSDTNSNLYAEVSYLRGGALFSQVHWDNLSFAQSVSTVPEPNSVALVLIAGMGSVYLLCHRRRQTN